MNTARLHPRAAFTTFHRLYRTQNSLPSQGPRWSSAASPEGKSLIGKLLDAGKWKLSPSGDGIQREFDFKGFNKAMEFWEMVSVKCKTERHHPEWANVYNRVIVRWTTHNPSGLSDMDAHMATICDQVAMTVGVAPPKDKTIEKVVDPLIQQVARNCEPCRNKN